MNILNLKESVELNKTILFFKDKNNRDISVYKLKNILLSGSNLFYPNCLLYSKNNKKLYNPIDESIASLKQLNKKIKFDIQIKDTTKTELNPVFYFIYNTDNYYHFIYDTLPYIISFKYLKKTIPNLKLLMNYPNHQANKIYNFVKEFLELLDINYNDIIFVDKNTCYETIYVSSSYTHGHDSNIKPRKEIYELYKNIVNKVNNLPDNKEYPKKIYISRRSWIHKDYSNIGTNYTTRRSLVNENELVDLLSSHGYTEVFTENMSTIEKIKLFSKVESIVGAIGGGVCNVLFSKPQTNLLCLVSPTFLDINSRFIHSLSNVNTKYIKNTEHIETGKWKKYMRVSYNNIVGEIIDIDKDTLTISYSSEFVAGWNNEMEYSKIKINSFECTALDSGLNSSWKLDLNIFKKYI